MAGQIRLQAVCFPRFEKVPSLEACFACQRASVSLQAAVVFSMLQPMLNLPATTANMATGAAYCVGRMCHRNEEAAKAAIQAKFLPLLQACIDRVTVYFRSECLHAFPIVEAEP